MVKDLITGSQSSKPRSLFNFNDKLVFGASDIKGNIGLWESDGTISGTNLLYEGDLTIASNPNYCSQNGDLYFVGLLEQNGFELLKYSPLTTWSNVLSDYNIKVFPNPTTGLVNFERPDYEDGTFHFYLFDIRGRKIMDKEITTTNFQINLGNMQSGTYLFQINSGNSKHNGKIILK